MRCLLRATAETVKSLRQPLLDAHYVQNNQRGAAVLRILLEEIKPGVRYGTVAWIEPVIANEAREARFEGCDDLADKLYRASSAFLIALGKSAGWTD